MQKQAKATPFLCAARNRPRMPSVVTCTNGWIKSRLYLILSLPVLI